MIRNVYGAIEDGFRDAVDHAGPGAKRVEQLHERAGFVEPGDCVVQRAANVAPFFFRCFELRGSGERERRREEDDPDDCAAGFARERRAITTRRRRIVALV